MTASAFALIDAAPASPSDSGHPALAPATGNGCSESAHDRMPMAMLVCSVIAENTSALSVVSRDISQQRINNVVKRVLMRNSYDEILDWRRRVPPPEWLIRWDCARKATAMFYPELPCPPDLHAIDNASAADPG